MPTSIRVGLIGLGLGTADLAPGLWGAKAHLPYLLASPKYQLVAVANSTVESALKAIEYHNLSSEVKAYGSPSDLANDPNVDLVIVCVGVSKHYKLTKPALLAGKDVFVEWPLGASLKEAEELEKMAKEKGVKTIMGLQARASPLVVKVKQLVEKGEIGKVLSTTVVGSFAPFPHDIWPVGAEYYLDKDSGGNPLTINFGHFLDRFTLVLGGFKDLKSILKTDYPTTNIIDAKGEVVYPNHPKSAPDHIAVLGTLKSGAPASLTYRTVTGKTIDGVSIRWLITGTEGEIEVTTGEAQFQMENPGTTLRVKRGKEGQVKTIGLEGGVDGEDKLMKEMSWSARNTARLYEAFVEGNGDRFADFEGAVEMHKLLDLIREAAK